MCIHSSPSWQITEQKKIYPYSHRPSILEPYTSHSDEHRWKSYSPPKIKAPPPYGIPSAIYIESSTSKPLNLPAEKLTKDSWQCYRTLFKTIDLFPTMKSVSSLCVLVALTLTACSNLTDKDYRLTEASIEAQENGSCHIHHCQMQRKVVPIAYGLMYPHPSGPSSQTRARRFPHANEWVSGGCVISPKKTAEVYVCSECKRAEEKWMNRHPHSQWTKAKRAADF